MEQRITKIEAVKGSKKRKVYVNDCFLFSIYPGELREYGLKEGMELSAELYKKIEEELLLPRAKRRVMNLLLAKDRSRKELEDKLLSDGYPKQAAYDAIAFVESYHYIDDFRYAARVIRAGQEEKSKKQIMMKLLEKGISRDVAEEAFELVRQERMELQGDDFEEAELSAIRKLVQKKAAGCIDSLTEKERQKIMASLYAKGFSGNYIRQVLQQSERVD